MPTDLPQTISSFGSDIDGVFDFIWWIILFWLIASEAVLVYFLIKYRRKSNVRAAWIPAKRLRVAAWILVPAAVVTVFDLLIEAKSAPVWAKVKERMPPHELLVRVTARQFAWAFTYAGKDKELDTADDFQTVNDLHVPVGKVVRLQLESVDVLHAFWVPTLRLKQDIVPGRSIPAWFKAEKVGRYEIGCAELCGAGHTAMRATLRVVPPSVFATWAKARAGQQAQLSTRATRR